VSGSLFALLGLELPDVELKLFAFEDVSIGATDLTRAGGDGGEDTASLELLLQQGVDLGRLLAVVVFLLRLFGALLVEKRLVSLGKLDALLPAERRGVMRLVPLTERGGVDGNDGVLDESLGSHELVVAGVVYGVDDTRLASNRLRSPREVSGVQPKSSSLDVATPDSDQMDAVTADFGHRGRTTHFILSLLLVGGPLATGLPLLMPLCLRNTHLATQILNK